MSIATLRLRESAEASVASHHPWILSTSLQKSIQPIDKDSVVDVVDRENRFIGQGVFNPDSRIAVRIYTWKRDEPLSDDLIAKRIERAVHLRTRRVNFLNSTEQQVVSRRLVFSEADQLSGLVVDAYGPYLVVQITASAMMQRLELIQKTLQQLVPVRGVLLRVDESTASREGMAERNEILCGEIPSHEVFLIENDLLFSVDLLGGQKTGHYLDQRQNRLAAASWIEPGSKILDICSYTGGFACTLAKTVDGCQVTAVDASQKALDLATRNAEINGLTNVSVEQSDFYKALEKRLEAGELLDAIILDPPRMASARSQVDRALAAYHRLNYLAVRILRPGGVLVTCSCSGRVSRLQFQQMLLGVSKRSGREIQVLEQRAAADDHPVLVNCPETDYLKCFITKIL